MNIRRNLLISLASMSKNTPYIMKRIYRYLLITVLALGSSFYSCETIELENLNDPNNLTPDLADANNLLNSVQLSYRAAQLTFSDNAAALVRIDYFFGRDYFANLGSGTLNGPWGNLYSAMLPDIANIEILNTDDTDLSFHLGIAKTMQAHLMMQLVDFLGDIVWTEANNPSEFPTPMLDDDQSVYEAAIEVLDEGLMYLNMAPDDAPTGVIDLFHADSGDETAKWIKVNNTIRMRYNLTTGNYGAVLNPAAQFADVIDDAADDFEFPYGTNVQQPDNRHPDYGADYTDSGANIYQSHWLMGLMDSRNDPRTRYYFYRQNECTPGASCDPEGDGETLQCSLQTPPVHYTQGGFTFCYLENGYWGRDHGNEEGTPPDNFTRTAVGVYPAGGEFDDDAFGNVGLGTGAGGFGIEPIFLSSYVDFMRADAALSMNMAGQAATYLESAMTKSIAKVQSFGANDPDADLSFEPSSDDVAAYIADTVAAFNSASGEDQWDVLGEQYFIALFGGGTDAYNFYRRTGNPTTLQPNLEPNPGAFPRTFLYPSNEVIANPNIVQRTDNATQVFWDTNPAGPAFPPAN